jgi:two-component system, OmpR family, response regulator VicR
LKLFWSGICVGRGEPNDVYMKKKILLVDDNQDLLLITQVILKSQGYEVALASTVQEAETAIEMGLPALILMDVNLDGEDGCAFCKVLKADPATKDIKVILMSGDDDNSLVAGSTADDFLPKPFDFSELTTRVEKQLATLGQEV